MSKNNQKLIKSIFFLLLVCIILFHKVLFKDYLFQGGDSLSPKAIRMGIENSIDNYGEYPLWMPWIFSGMPSIHSFQNISEFYFPHLLMKGLMSLGVPQFWEFIFHFIFSALGMIFLLKYLNINHMIAFWGGVSYMMMPYLVTMIVHGHGSQMMTTAYIPWIMLFCLKLHHSPSLLNVGLLAFFMGLQLQRAHVQIAYYTWMLVGLYVVVNIFFHLKNKESFVGFIVHTIPAFLLSICMSMWIYYPAASYTPFSIRGGGEGGGTGIDYATQWSFSIGEMLTFFIPSYYGFGGVTYWGNMPFTDYPNYMGIFSLLFSIYALFLYRDRFRFFLIIASLFTLFLSFGHNFKLFYEFFYSYFPFFNKFRVPVMILVLLQFNVVVMAALGFNDLIERIKLKSKINKFYILNVFFLLFIFIIYMLFNANPASYENSNFNQIINTLRVSIMSRDTLRIIFLLLIGLGSIYAASKNIFNYAISVYVIIILTIFDLFIVDKMIIEPDRNSYRQSTLKKKEFFEAYFKEDSIIKFLKSDSSKYRILPLGALENQNRWAAFEIESVSGYHPAKLHNYNNFIKKIGWSNLGVLEMLNVKYIVSQEIINHQMFSLVHKGSLYVQDQYIKANVYKFNNFKNRLFFSEKIIIKDKKQIFDEISNINFDSDKVSFVSEELSKIEFDDSSTAELVSWSPNKIVVKTITNSKQFLVISEIFYPNGWYINNYPDMEIVEVNNLIRGLIVPPGEFTFEMIFEPSDIKYGSFLTYSSLLLIMILLFFEYVKKRK